MSQNNSDQFQSQNDGSQYNQSQFDNMLLNHYMNNYEHNNNNNLNNSGPSQQSYSSTVHTNECPTPTESNHWSSQHSLTYPGSAPDYSYLDQDAREFERDNRSSSQSTYNGSQYYSDNTVSSYSSQVDHPQSQYTEYSGSDTNSLNQSQ